MPRKITTTALVRTATKQVSFAILTIGLLAVASEALAQSRFGGFRCSQGACRANLLGQRQLGNPPFGAAADFDLGIVDPDVEELDEDDFDLANPLTLDPLDDPSFDDPRIDGGPAQANVDPILRARSEIRQRTFNRANDAANFRNQLRRRSIQNSVSRVGRIWVVSYLLQDRTVERVNARQVIPPPMRLNSQQARRGAN